MRISLLFLLFPLYLSAAEPSAFGAGDLDSDNPYGLTETEKKILENKKILKEIEKKSYSQKSRVQSLQERIDGLQTIVEGIAEKSQSNRLALKQLQGSYDLSESRSLVEINELKSSVTKNSEQIEQLKKILTELSGMLDAINTNYVSKNELNDVIKEINDFKSSVAQSFKSLGGGGSNAASDLASTSNAEIAKKAYALYKKKYYTKAIEYYTYLIEKKYKPARAHFMIGEMWYYRKNYKKAIAYFKESARLFDKASYMPTLLMHSAVAMEKTGDTEHAESFLEALIANYPDSKLAEDAKKRLSRLR